MKKVLFVCTGNTCRSPLAEAVFNNLKPDGSYEARSAGMMAMNGMPMSEGSRTALTKRGLKEEHLSQGLTRDLLDWADLVLTMTENHKRTVIQQFPEEAGNIYTLKEFIYDDPATKQLIEKMDHHIAQLELKRAEFIKKHEDKIKKYNEDQDIKHQQQLEEELLAQLKPEQEAIEYAASKLPSFNISDPFGAADDVYEITYKEIEEAVKALIEKMKKHNGEQTEEEF